MKVLIVSAHLDDETLGMGGTIARHVDEGDDVTILFLCGREYGRIHSEKTNSEEWQCTEKAKDILGYQNAFHPTPMLPDGDLDKVSIRDVIDPIEKLSESLRPDVAYIPFWGDIHQDHRAVSDACMIALRTINKHRVNKVLCYECPSTTEQSLINKFAPNYYVNIEKYIETKLEAVKCYEREGRKYPHPRSPEQVKTYAQWRGLQCHLAFAEGFILLREIR